MVLSERITLLVNADAAKTTPPIIRLTDPNIPNRGPGSSFPVKKPTVSNVPIARQVTGKIHPLQFNL
jgi:hypothetical protein